jgi:DNA gyrase subunit A
LSYRVRAGVTSRAVEAHRIHLRTEPTDAVVLVSSQGRAWWGTVGRLPQTATFPELGLTKGEVIVAADTLSDGDSLVVGTSGGQVKRVKAGDVRAAAEATWAPIIGLSGKEDRVLFAGTGDDKADVLFFTSGRAIRFAAGGINPQATPTARGVSGIKARKGDGILGGAVMRTSRAKRGVVVVSQNGYIKWVPLEEFPVQGRGGQGVVLLNRTQATGPVVAAAAGRMAQPVDLLDAGGKRQRLTDVPTTNRANRGAKKVRLKDVVEAVVL